MPTIDRVRGYRFFFYSNEAGEPPHIHVENGGCYAKYWLDPVALANPGGFNVSELMKLRRIVTEKRELYQEKWNEFFGR